MHIDLILQAIKKRCFDLKIKFDNKGYVDTFEDNLISSISNWGIIKKEFDNGDGSELKGSDNKLPKFKSIYSSAALCVNNFASIKQRINQSLDFNFLDYGGFDSACFESKLSSGLKGHCPNLDFILKNDSVIIGIESKFTEFFTAKLPNAKRNGKSYGNLEPYFKSKKLDYLKDFKSSVVKYYMDCPNKMYLDASQLIKHTLGLLNNSTIDKKAVLIYIYWLPENWRDFDIFTKHEIEIAEFKTIISPYIEFISLSYLDYWAFIEKDMNSNNYFDKVKERYLLKV